MKNCPHLLKVSLIAAVVFSFAGSAVAQLTLESSVPADGATNVGSPATFQLTFSAPLDTTARFEEPEDFFLGLIIIPEDSTGDPQDISLSQDLRTVTVSGLALTEDTQFSILVTGARSTTGESLDRPYGITFTTGSSLPSGSVSGTVNFNGATADGAAVALFPVEYESEDPLVAGVMISSSFTVNYVPDGQFMAMSLKDTNEDGELDPSSGDAVGFYDANQDGQPDILSISGGNSVTGITIELSEPVLQTARGPFTDVESAALDWATDAVLVAIDAGDLDPSGQSFDWFYLYHSPSQQSFQGFSLFGDGIMSEPFNDPQFQPPTTGLPDTWVDSDVAAAAAEANGGSQFRAMYPDAEAHAALQYFDWYGNGEENATDGNRPVVKYTSSLNGGESTLVAWHFDYWSESSQEDMRVEINALTGTTMASDVLGNLQTAEQEAQAWASDAELVQIYTDSELDTTGRAIAWVYVYRSTAQDSAQEFVMISNTLQECRPPEFGVPMSDPLPNEFCNSTEAVALAQSESETFRATHPEVYVYAVLSRGMTQNPDQAVWRIAYDTPSQDFFEVFIDAETCVLVTDIAESASAPDVLTLHQNYPNPFNPETEIRFELPQTTHVTVTIYNILGQNVKTLIDGVRPAGAYRLRWHGVNALGQQVPSGVYIYTLSTEEFSQTKRMLLLR